MDLIAAIAALTLGCKYPEADYNEQRRALEDEAAQAIAEMEALMARGMKSTRARA